MQARLILSILNLLYKTILREIIVKSISDPDTQVDDFIINLLDNLFDYS